jgi:hypothetical protein
MTEEKKRPLSMTQEEWEFHLETQRKLLERIRYHERKIEEEKAAREAQSGSDR